MGGVLQFAIPTETQLPRIPPEERAASYKSRTRWLTGLSPATHGSPPIPFHCLWFSRQSSAAMACDTWRFNTRASTPASPDHARGYTGILSLRICLLRVVPVDYARIVKQTLPPVPSMPRGPRTASFRFRQIQCHIPARIRSPDRRLSSPEPCGSAGGRSRRLRP